MSAPARSLPFSPLSLNQLTRDLWPNFDPVTIAQLAGLALDECYTIKFYKAPADDDELVAAYGYAPYGMQVTPGSIIYGYYLPIVQSTGLPSWQGTVQITDQSLKCKWFDDPLSNLFLSNYVPTYQASPSFSVYQGSFPHLLDGPYVVVGTGLFLVELQSTAAVQQRMQLVFGVLEVCG